jgi:tetratricopeptide (TPR) repeat protein
VTSALSSTGRIIPLVNSLYQDSEWELIYRDGRSIIFLKASENNYDLIHQYRLSKEKIYDEIISEGTQGIKESPATWGYYETLGFVYMKQNRFDDALFMFEKYLSMNPGNQTIRHYYELVKRYVKEYNK